jgi:hypothetical protein
MYCNGVIKVQHVKKKKCAESLKTVEQVSMMMIVLVSSAHQAQK